MGPLCILVAMLLTMLDFVHLFYHHKYNQLNSTLFAFQVALSATPLFFSQIWIRPNQNKLKYFLSKSEAKRNGFSKKLCKVKKGAPQGKKVQGAVWSLEISTMRKLLWKTVGQNGTYLS